MLSGKYAIKFNILTINCQKNSELCNNDLFKLGTLFPGSKDPFIDSVKDELIGVSFLHIDPMQYLLDIDDSLKIINFNGDVSGYLKLNLRSWIDVVEPIPPYITVDLEVNVKDNMNKKLITRVYFEYLSKLPVSHCAESYIYFKFMRQFPVYLTPRCLGSSTHPIIDHTIQIEEIITADLVEYIKTGTIEFEIFGKKKTSLEFNNKYIDERKRLFMVGEINYRNLLRDELDDISISDESDEENEEKIAMIDYKAKNDLLMKEIQYLKNELENKNKLLKNTKKINDNIRLEKDVLLEKHIKETSEQSTKITRLEDTNKSLSFKINKIESEKVNKKTSKNSSSCSIQ